MTPKEVIKELWGPAKLAKETNIPRRTLYSYSEGSRKRVSGPTMLLFKILLILRREGGLEEVLSKARKIDIEEE